MWKKSPLYFLIVLISLGSRAPRLRQQLSYFSPRQGRAHSCVIARRRCHSAPSGGSSSVTVTAASHCTWTCGLRPRLDVDYQRRERYRERCRECEPHGESGGDRTHRLPDVAGLAVSVVARGSRLVLARDLAQQRLVRRGQRQTAASPSPHRHIAGGRRRAAHPGSRVTSGSPGAGNGTVGYSIDRNADTSTHAPGPLRWAIGHLR